MPTAQQMYGGAMEVVLPESFIDTSKFREVPDHQEVWADMDTNQSMILEVLDVIAGKNGTELAKFHFEEIGRANGCAANEMRVEQITELSAAELPNFANATTRVLIRGEQQAAKFKETVKNTVAVEVLVLRLPPPADTDLLLSINTPTVVDPSSTEASAPKASASPFSSICSSLVIKDYGLFGV
eukprot:TRINITY_DN5973_c0_g1_i1.p2 TRINITY_DN5973_c0_g1~~TRINITY_DN5973_c0_g1_i1.p2  ORF type:complete len:184 (+),score=49.06 TRINITY_DN5973_c0_g1_i1:42-593(+)